jgi:hypothetical protein
MIMTLDQARALYPDACTLLSSTKLPAEAPLRAFLREKYPHVRDDGFVWMQIWMQIVSTRVFIILAQAYMESQPKHAIAKPGS